MRQSQERQTAGGMRRRRFAGWNRYGLRLILPSLARREQEPPERRLQPRLAALQRTRSADGPPGGDLDPGDRAGQEAGCGPGGPPYRPGNMQPIC